MRSVLVPCPKCSTLNRVQPERRLHAVCGKCNAGILPGTVLDLDGPGFQRHVSKCELPLVVDFWSPTCGPCLQMAPQFGDAASRMKGDVVFAKLNTQLEQQAAMSQNIRGVPTLVLYRAGREIARQAGAMGASQIVQWVRGNL